MTIISPRHAVGFSQHSDWRWDVCPAYHWWLVYELGTHTWSNILQTRILQCISYTHKKNGPSITRLLGIISKIFICSEHIKGGQVTLSGEMWTDFLLWSSHRLLYLFWRLAVTYCKTWYAEGYSLPSNLCPWNVQETTFTQPPLHTDFVHTKVQSESRNKPSSGQGVVQTPRVVGVSVAIRKHGNWWHSRVVRGHKVSTISLHTPTPHSLTQYKALPKMGSGISKKLIHMLTYKTGEIVYRHRQLDRSSTLDLHWDACQQLVFSCPEHRLPMHD